MPENVRIRKETYIAMNAHASEAYPDECCGMLLREDREPAIIDIRKVKNSASPHNASERFIIDPAEVYRAELELEKEGFEIMGFYHSHPDKAAGASRMDREYMIPGMLYIIISVFGGNPENAVCYMKDQTGREVITVDMEII